MDTTAIIQQFLDHLNSQGLGGLTLEDVIPDGRRHRWTVEGDARGSKNGWYKLHLDNIPAAGYGSWKTGQKGTWVARIDRKLTADERKQLEGKIAIERAERERIQARRYARAAKFAAQIWASSAANPSHPYLDRKGIRPNGARLVDWKWETGEVDELGKPVRTVFPSLVIPARDESGIITSLQFIHPQPIKDGKRWLPGGKVEGSYFTIAKAKPTEEDPILICEGFATGASLHAATDFTVVVAFNTGNLAHVGPKIRGKFPRNKIIVCADNDQFTSYPVKNPGLHYATALAAEIQAAVALPVFDRLEGKPTDFNDLAQREGLGKVNQIVMEALSSMPANAAHAFEPVPMPDVEQDDQGEPRTAPARAESKLVRYPMAIQYPDVKANGKPVATIENVVTLLDRCEIVVRYDVIKKDLEIKIPNEEYLIDTAKNDKLTRIISIASRSGLPTNMIPEFVAYVGSRNPYNPAAEWIASRPWDGISRLQEFYSTIVAKGEIFGETRRFKETLMLKWMVSACAAAFSPRGVSAHGVLTLQGEQYLGKTQWFKKLVPAELGITADGMILKPDDKDSVFQVVSNWLVELGEMDATFRSSDISRLKAFITKDQDTLRRPYARGESQYARRTVFFASVNPEDFLRDPTGNRRFWTIPCEDLNHAHGLDMQQVWAEFYDLYRSGQTWFLTQEENKKLSEWNRAFETVTPIDELIRVKYEWDAVGVVSSMRTLTATEVALEIGIRQPQTQDIKTVGKALREISGQEPKKSNGKLVYKVPRLASDNVSL